MEKIQEMFKRKVDLMNNTITEMKNTLEGFNSRITKVEERLSELD